MVRYKPKSQKTGIAMTTDITAGTKLKSLNKISSSSLKKKANQVHKTHKLASVIIAIALFMYL